MATVQREWTKDDMRAVLTRATERALVAVGLLLEGAAARRAPVGQYRKGSGRVGGRLRGSITHAVYNRVSATKSAQNKAGDAVSSPNDHFTLHVGTNVEYAAFREYGTRYMQPKAFLRPAFDENKAACKRLYADELAKGMRDGK